MVTANAGRELRNVSVTVISGALVQELARAAPQLVAFKVGMTHASVAVSTCMLRNEAPFGTLQLRGLRTIGPDDGEAPLDEPQLLAFCSAVSAHASLRRLELVDTSLDSPDVVDALSAAALAINLHDLKLNGCELSPAAAPALARLIRGGALQSLLIDNGGGPLLDEATAVQLADALAASRTLTQLKLSDVGFWGNAAAAAAVVHALTGHPHLQELDLSDNHPPDQLAAGAALGALVAADVPALTSLTLCNSEHGDVGLGGLCDALPRNTHLRKLDLRSTGTSAAFARDTLSRAVCANTSLRELGTNEMWSTAYQHEYDKLPPGLREVRALLTERGQAAQAAADANV